MSSPLKIADRQFNSRLFLGTGKFASNQIMREAVLASKSELVTVALKRIDIADKDDQLLSSLKIPNVSLLPNTSGARNAKEAILAANLAREALETNWVKLEIHPDPNYLMPDPIETLEAAKILAADNFVVLPYIHADPVLCKKLEDVGVSAVMPLAAPIGSNLGLSMIHMLQIIVEQSEVPVIVDAGLGAPSHAAQALEIGADAVLVNTAIAVCENPQNMALAFALAVEAGRLAFEATLASSNPASAKLSAQASSPLTAFAA